MLLFFGIPFTLMGVVALIMSSSMPIPGPMAAPFLIIPIVWMCVGITLIIIAIIYSKKESASYDEFAKHISEEPSEYEGIGSRISPSTTDVTSLTCPKCGAPIKSEPPCRCEYCGVLIR